jgi:uncharacterized protein YqgV (UPF0045/DUF77 family)
MMVQAELSLYPLGISDISEPIHRFCDELRKNGMEVHVGAMSSIVNGECENLMGAIAKATEAIGNTGQFVLSCKISNACPIYDSREGSG